MIRLALALTWRLPSASAAAWLPLPPVVNQGLVRLGHAVRVVPAFDRGALLAESVNDFGGQTLGHGASLAGPRPPPHPAAAAQGSGRVGVGGVAVAGRPGTTVGLEVRAGRACDRRTELPALRRLGAH